MMLNPIFIQIFLLKTNMWLSGRRYSLLYVVLINSIDYHDYILKQLGSIASYTEIVLLIPHGRRFVFVSWFVKLMSPHHSDQWSERSRQERAGLVNPHGWRFHTVLPSNPTSAHKPFYPAPDYITDTEFKIKNEKLYQSYSWIGMPLVLIFGFAPESFIPRLSLSLT